MGDTATEAGGALVEKADSSAQELIRLIEKLIEKAIKDNSTEIARRIREIDELIERERKRIDDLGNEIEDLDEAIEKIASEPLSNDTRRASKRLKRRKEECEADREAAEQAKKALEEQKRKLIEKLSQ